MFVDAHSRPDDRQLAGGQQVERHVLREDRHREPELVDGGRVVVVLVLVDVRIVERAIRRPGAGSSSLEPAVPAACQGVGLVPIVHGARSLP